MGILKVKPWGKGQGDHVLINAEDFDPKFHKKFVAKKKAAKKPVKKYKYRQEINYGTRYSCHL